MYTMPAWKNGYKYTKFLFKKKMSFIFITFMISNVFFASKMFSFVSNLKKERWEGVGK
jgi:hypothetical protein